MSGQGEDPEEEDQHPHRAHQAQQLQAGFPGPRQAQRGAEEGRQGQGHQGQHQESGKQINLESIVCI